MTYKDGGPRRIHHAVQSGRSAQQPELESRPNFDRWSLDVLYGNSAAQPALGFLEDRQSIMGSVKFDQTRIGLGYVDDCLTLALNYATSYTYSGIPEINHTIMLQLNLRTLGGTSLSQGIGGSSGIGWP